jgi:arabinofuranan 3-O-arabinosyltransferase
MIDNVALAAPVDGPAEPTCQDSPWRRRWAAWRFPLLAYAAPVGITVLATLTWFSWGRFGASGDIPPFVRDNLAGEVTSSWNHQATGAGSTSPAILQLVDVALIRGLRLVGLGAPAAQWLLYAGCFALCTFGAAYLAGAWVRRPAAIAAAGLLASFNVYVLIWLPNPLPPLAIGLAGLLSGMVARTAGGQRRINPVWFAAATTPIVYVALNPPWLVVTILSVLFVAIGAGLVSGGRALRRAWSMLVRALPWMLLFNLWWIVAFVQQLLFPAGQAFSASTDTRDWAWTHIRATAANVVTLNTYWGWDVPGYFPFAPVLDAGLQAKLRWMFPLLALAGVVLVTGRRRRRAAWLIAAVGLVLLFLSTGLRSARFGGVNLWLYDHVPGMWLIRDPGSKLGVPIVVSYASLAAVAVDRVIELSSRLAAWLRRVRGLRWLPPRAVTAVPRVAAAGVVLGALAFPSPMWTGAAFPDKPHGGVPGARVAIPDGWYRMARAVNSDRRWGKIITLPINVQIYTVGTTWGYHGVDNVPAQLFKRPTLHLMPSGYYDDLPAVKSLVTEVQTALLAGDQQSALGALRALGVDTVIVRHDLKPTASDGPVTADPARLDAALARVAGINPAGEFGVGALYQVTDPAGRISSRGWLTGVQGPDATATAAAAAALPDGEVASTDPDQPVDAFAGSTVDSGDMRVTLAAAGHYRFDRTGTEADYRATVTDGRLTLTDADAVTVDGQPLPNRPALQMNVTDPAVLALGVDAALHVLPPGGAVVPVGPGTAVTAYAAQPGNGLAGPFRAAPDCGGVSDAHPGDDPLRLAVRSGRVCAVAPLTPTGTGTYRIHLQARNEGQATPRICLWQGSPDGCATLPAPPTGSAWTDYTAVTRLPPDATAAQLYLYAESAGGSGVAEYRDVDVTPLRPVGSGMLTPAPAPPVTLALAAGRHTVSTHRQAPTAAGRPEYGFCATPVTHLTVNHPYDIRTPVQPDGVQLLDTSSRYLCAQADTVPVVPGATYRFSAGYRTSFGQSPHICVWQEGAARRCADIPPLARSADWLTTSFLLRPPTSITSLTPQALAFTSAMVPSRVSYRDVSLTRVTLVSVRATPTDRVVASTPRVGGSIVSASRYRAAVHGATGRFTLVLAESYGAGWSLDGLPAGWSARHLVVDGYANGWVIDGTGDADLTMEYTPSRWGFAALLVSVLATTAAITLTVGRWLAARRRREQRQNQLEEAPR